MRFEGVEAESGECDGGTMTLRVSLLGAVALALWLAPARAWDTTLGCCACTDNTCREATYHECDEQQRHYPDCYFVSGGQCDAYNHCVVPTSTPRPTKTATKTRTPTSTRPTR